jgi:hypothetical protein
VGSTPTLGTNLFNDLRACNSESLTDCVVSSVPIVCGRHEFIFFAWLALGVRNSPANNEIELTGTTDRNPLPGFAVSQIEMIAAGARRRWIRSRVRERRLVGPRLSLRERPECAAREGGLRPYAAKP